MVDIKFDAAGLVPAIIQNAETGKVLMLGYMNAESLRLTLEKGTVWFFSRSRQKLWNKGETSGNFLHVVSARYDCDADALLFECRPDGPTCHTGSESCFFNDIELGGNENG
ncbi:MAG: phosphoribosyl-AMP cyclohydrolase [Oscillospiraceae bacterium]|nr:phosphoribosyl-AMP cyclohydrolase [Oscillospiraceae bacterium]